MPEYPSRHFRKPIRLPLQNYAQPGSICSVTAAVQNRKTIFSDTDLAGATVEVLRSHSSKTNVTIYGYCIMPDHVHLVLSPSATCSIITFVGQFKNLSQRAAWNRGVQGSFWQKSFWDHFLRAEEQVERVVEYVLNNPVRGGLVENWKEYPFSGSFVIDLRK